MKDTVEFIGQERQARLAAATEDFPDVFPFYEEEDVPDTFAPGPRINVADIEAEVAEMIAEEMARGRPT